MINIDYRSTFQDIVFHLKNREENEKYNLLSDQGIINLNLNNKNSPEYSYIKNYENDYFEYERLLGEHFNILFSFGFELSYYVYIKKMKYSDYLNTLYWHIYSTTLKMYGKCILCGKRSDETVLHVHHSDYRYKGFEFLFDDCTVVLCQKCHKKFHGKV